MGEIADMMLDGTLCQTCGEYVGGDGFPTFCASCASEQPSGDRTFAQPRNPGKVACTMCGRHVRTAGLNDHMRDKHAVGNTGSER